MKKRRPDSHTLRLDESPLAKPDEEDGFTTFKWEPEEPVFTKMASAFYAILDGARDPLIYEMLASSDAPWCCLFAGALEPAVLRASPYLVHLDPRFVPEDFLQEVWSHGWGLLLHTAAGFEDLRRHLRSFLRVKIEDGGLVLFRYYDPRVMHAYLPTCTVEELEYVFGPVRSYFVELEDGDACEYRLVEGSLETKLTTIDAVLSEPHAAMRK